MHFSRVTPLALSLLVSYGQAAPTSEARTLHQAMKRADPANCGGIMYTAATQADAYAFTIDALKGGTTYTGDNGRVYPQQFNNREMIVTDACPAGTDPANLYEFPVYASGRQYTGGSQPPDRAVVLKVDDDNYTQCWIMTHKGAKKNKFNLC